MRHTCCEERLFLLIEMNDVRKRTDILIDSTLQVRGGGGGGGGGGHLDMMRRSRRSRTVMRKPNG
jgi:hypothetical protein